jgi:dipeptidyl aminopeptidase/acylaminoacyl peptidase
VAGPGDAQAVVSTGWQSLQGLAFSPDGRELWFAGSRSSRSRALHAVTLAGRERLIARVPGQLTLQDVGAGGRALLTRDSARFEIAGRLPGEARERNLSWLDGSLASDLSRDGRTLLFSEAGEAGGAANATYLRRAEGGPPVKLGDGLPTSLSPDGRQVLVLRRGTGGTRLMALPTGPGDEREIPIAPLSDVLWAYWHPDGRHVLVTGAASGEPVRTHLVDPAQPGAQRAVTPEGLWLVAISGDASQMAAVGTGKPIHIVQLADGRARELPGTQPGDRPSHFSDDGRSLFVFRRDEVPGRVWRVDVATGRRGLHRELLPADPAGVVALSEVLELPDARGYVYSYLRLLSELYLGEGLR